MSLSLASGNSLCIFPQAGQVAQTNISQHSSILKTDERECQYHWFIINLLELQYMYKESAIVSLLLLALLATCAPDTDSIRIPGYDDSYPNRAFAGYLKTQSELRKLHYVFVEGNKGVNNSMPVTLWMNGGPGCISKIGLVREISAYCLGEDQPYADLKDLLTFNAYAWTNVSNLLFIDGPAGVGFSINNDPDYIYNDVNTARDNLFALKDFYSKFPEYANNTFFIAGQSYAGKYIPDLALRILDSRAIPLKGIIIGNPVLSFTDLYVNRVEWMMSHNFVDPQLMPYWEKSCKNDIESAGCQYFYERYQDLVYRVDEYNIYGKCYGRKGPRQRAILADLSLKMSPFYKYSKEYIDQGKLRSGEWCSYDEGIQNYLNINNKTFNSVKKENITVCNMDIYNKYQSEAKGSITLLPTLLQKGLKVYLFTGDWDDVVPFTDTYMNLQKMGLQLQRGLLPWLVAEQHAGFIRNYSYGLVVFHVKAAGHEVPLYQRERAFRMFEKFVSA